MKIIRYTADWCGPCRQLVAVLKEANPRVDIEIVDVDKEPERTKENNVRGVPTMQLLSDSGNEISRKVGALTKAQLVSWFDSNGVPHE